MAALQNALQTLSPINADSVPQSPHDLNNFLSSTFHTSDLLIDSVPLPPPSSSTSRPRSTTTTSVASSSSEITLSDVRPADPSPDIEKLQKAWGKPLRLTAKENPLGISVYKLAGTDGKGAWFARRSVHEGLGFGRWKRGLQLEFPETMKVDGGPGVGNIRGIGGERCVECREAAVGKMEVYHLSAQFPGPTTPRDFVTMLLTTDRVVEEDRPRQFMVVSKPCVHPQTPERNGFIRGQYQSVEMIREVPVTLSRAKSASMNDLSVPGRGKKSKKDHKRTESPTSNLDRDAILRSVNESHPAPDENGTNISGIEQSNAPRAPSEDRRRRGKTISFAGSRGTDAKGEHHDIPTGDPELNPVEWIMITRSDPGGSVPRFMVERGTPSSIVADAAKFLDWACSAALDVGGKEEQVPRPCLDGAESESKSESGPDAGVEEDHHPTPQANISQTPLKEISLREYQTNGHLAGLDGVRDPPPNEHYTAPVLLSPDSALSTPTNNGLFSMVSSAASLLASTPSVLTSFLPSTGYAAALPHALPRARRFSSSSSSTSDSESEVGREPEPTSPSAGSLASFASALESRSNSDAEGAGSASAVSLPPNTNATALRPSTSSDSLFSPPPVDAIPPVDTVKNREASVTTSSSTNSVQESNIASVRLRANAVIDKERAKFAERKGKLGEKLEKLRKKEEAKMGEGEGGRERIAKAEEKYERDLRREEGRMEKEIARVEARRERDVAKVLQKTGGAVNEAARGNGKGVGGGGGLESAEREIQVLRVERELLRRQVGELQRENTALAMGIGRLEGGDKVLSELRGGRAKSLGLVAEGKGKENMRV